MTEADLLEVRREIARALRMLEKERFTRDACAVVADALDPPEVELKPLPCWSCGGPAITSNWHVGRMATCENSHCGVNGVWVPLTDWNRREVPHG